MDMVYRADRDTALRNNEIGSYVESKHSNEACKRTIEQAIGAKFDGFRLRPECLDLILRQFSLERVEFVTASTVRWRDYDGRISDSNKRWAYSVTLNPVREESVTYICDTHPAVFDGFVNLLRTEIKRRRT